MPIWALMLVMMGGMMVGMKLLHGGKGHDKQHGGKTAAVCPVTGEQVVVSSTTPRATVGGTVYYFHDEGHQRDFVLDPPRYLRDRAGQTHEGH